MPRSVWKGPFVENSLFEFAQKLSEGLLPPDKPKKIWSRRSVIIPDFVGIVFLVYNGRKFCPVNVNQDMVGRKFGEFAPTRYFKGHAGDKKVVKAKK